MALRDLWFLRQMSLVFSFVYFKFKGLALGFTHVESGPLARNSYNAEQQRARLFNRCPMSSGGAGDRPAQISHNPQFTSHSHKKWNRHQYKSNKN